MTRPTRRTLAWVGGTLTAALLGISCLFGGFLWLVAKSFEHDNKPPDEIVTALERHRAVLEREGDRLRSDPAACGSSTAPPYTDPLATKDADGDLRAALTDLRIESRFGGYCTAFFPRPREFDGVLLYGRTGGTYSPYSTETCQTGNGGVVSVATPIFGQWHWGTTIQCG